MGSGLILLVIVAAWIAVLVPMALRSHDSSASMSSVDRFSDAMRVLSRRDAAARARAREVAGPERFGMEGNVDLDEDDDALLLDEDDAYDDGPSRGALLLDRARDVLTAARDRARAASPAARRRRLLVGLVVLAVGTLVGGLVGPAALLVVHLLVDVALGLFVRQLRRLAVARAAPARRAGPVRRALPTRAAAGSVRVDARPAPAPAPADVPFVEPVVVGRPVAEKQSQLFDQVAFADEPAPVVEQVVATAEVDADPVGLGAPWTPIPVPAPIYTSAPAAPSRRAPEPARESEWTEPPSSEHLLGTVDEAPDLDGVVERRRAVNEW